MNRMRAKFDFMLSVFIFCLILYTFFIWSLTNAHKNYVINQFYISKNSCFSRICISFFFLSLCMEINSVLFIRYKSVTMEYSTNIMFLDIIQHLVFIENTVLFIFQNNSVLVKTGHWIMSRNIIFVQFCLQ
jgi:hypothetical protein